MEIYFGLNNPLFHYFAAADRLEQDTHYIDKTLFSRLAQGEEAAFRELVIFYHARMLQQTIVLVKSETLAREVMQEVFLKIWIKRSLLTEVEHPFSWFKTVIANTTANYIRTELAYELRNKKAGEAMDASLDIQGDVEVKFTQTAIEEAIGQLTERRREVYLMSRRDGLTRKEIASRLDLSENTVRNQLADAVDSIQQYLRQKGILVLSTILLLTES